MKLHLVTVGKGMPSWITEGYLEYSKRLPKNFELILHEVKPAPRGKKTSRSEIVAKEGRAILETIPEATEIIALDKAGTHWSTEAFAEQLSLYRDLSQDLTFVIGGPDGIDAEIMTTAHHIWSLSDLTFPHPLVRIIVAEQIYRAWTILNNHPYHRS